MNEAQLKEFYTDFHDQMIAKRFRSPYPVRSAVHHDIFHSILRHIDAGEEVLDAGCGEGMLAHLMQQKKARVTGLDISTKNIESAQTHFPEIRWQVGDLEKLPFADESFEVVVSNHVLEHLPDFDQGLAEVLRVAQKKVIIAIPTNLSPLSWALLGRDQYWLLTKRSPLAFPYAFLRLFKALITGSEGVDEGYAGNRQASHIHRFPWILKNKLNKLGYDQVKIEAQTLRWPYLPTPDFSRKLQNLPVLNYLGLGTVYVVEKKISGIDPQ